VLLVGNRLHLPGFAVTAPARNKYYFQYSRPTLPDVSKFVAKRPQREWSAEDKAVLKAGLLQLHADEHYSRLHHKYSAISQYIMRGRFSVKEIERAVRCIVRGHPDWKSLRPS
jgi:hypothetical protein